MTTDFVELALESCKERRTVHKGFNNLEQSCNMLMTTAYGAKMATESTSSEFDTVDYDTEMKELWLDTDYIITEISGSESENKETIVALLQSICELVPIFGASKCEILI